VQITYEVQTGDAVEVKELPLVVGLVADLAGQTAGPRLKDRKFVQIDKHNFDEVMKKMGPTLTFTVPNKIDSSSERIPVSLKFEELADFEPMALVRRVDKLRETYEKRAALNDLLAKIYVSDDLTSAINQVIQSSATDEELQQKLIALRDKL